MELLTKDEILKADDIQHKDVPVPEWGEGKGVRLMSLTGTQRDAFEDKSVVHKGSNTRMNLINMRARLLALVIVGPDDKRIFTDVEVNLLGQKNAAVLERLFDIAREMNGMTETDIEELAEGFGDDQSEDSTSA